MLTAIQGHQPQQPVCPQSGSRPLQQGSGPSSLSAKHIIEGDIVARGGHHRGGHRRETMEAEASVVPAKGDPAQHAPTKDGPASVARPI